MRENQLVHDILAAWGAHPRLRIARTNTGVGWYAHGMPARKTDPGAYPVRYGVPGTADICGLIAPTGRLLAIECKSATGKQRKEQLTFERVVVTMGGLYILARELATVDQALAELGVTR